MKQLVLFWAAMVAAAAACAAGAEYRLDWRGHALADSYRYDLRPGLRIDCRAKFDEFSESSGGTTIARKGAVDSPGAWLLRVDSPAEGGRFSFFVNHGTGPEPRVSFPATVRTGEWYAVSAGWDGTNSWLTVNGRTVTRRREGLPTPRGCAGDPWVGPMRGIVADLSVTGPEVETLPADVSCCAGFRISCTATFLAPPAGETTIAYKKGEYWLRYDHRKGQPGSFNFFVFLDGGWEPHASCRCDVETGRAYVISAGWDGRRSSISVDGESGMSVLRGGRCRPSIHPLKIGTEGRIAVSDLCIRNERAPIVSIDGLRTRELLPRLGSPARLVGSISNIGSELGACTLDVVATTGATVSPAHVEFAGIAETPMPLEWTVDAGTNGIVNLNFTVRQGRKKVHWTSKRLVFMPEKDPDLSAKAWNPPISPVRTYHVDAEGGDDARDGLTPATAWRTLARAGALTLGPGERLLLRRGSVFNEELKVSARGSMDNWAEIGAYGEGMRPRISRNRHINDRCGIVDRPFCLAVRDLVFCNAGTGFVILANASGAGYVLVERCLAHHIEGKYRFNAHGIPEWRDEGLGGSSCGIQVSGAHVVLRDCESYQCSSGFSVGGTDTFVTRMYCHDNFAHNTSPHPYNTASRSWMTDSVFDASGWHASAGTMGVMLANNCGFVIRGCHFVNQPDSGSYDQGGIDFECGGENCLIDECTFRNNAGAAIEVLGLRSPQTRNVHIRRCKFDRNNYAYKNGPAEIQVWGHPGTRRDVACSNGVIEDNGCVLIPGIPFYVNNSPTTNDWTLARNRTFDFPEELDRAFPYVDPPGIAACGEVWTDSREAALFATATGGEAALAWEQTEGPADVAFALPTAACTKATFPAEGDYRVAVKADNGTLWRTARTAVHVLPSGARTFKAWDFSRNLDSQGWRVERAGTGYEYLFAKNPLRNTFSFPVRLVCGDYFVIALKDSADAYIVTPDDMSLGVECSAARVNSVRIKMQNCTDSRRMRLWWQVAGVAPAWSEKNSVAFEVTPKDAGDSVYAVALPPAGVIKQLKLSFSGDGEKITGTCRIDYIWLGHLQEKPARPKPNIVGTTEKDPLAYRPNETMAFKLTPHGNGTTIRWRRTGDDGREEKGEAKADAPVVVKTALDRPGFVRLVAELVDASGKAVARFDGGAGVSVGKIHPDNPEPGDFDAFWTRHKATLAKVPMDGATCRGLPSGRADVKLYEVSIPCAGPRPSTGFLSIPAKPGRYPAIGRFHGYNASWRPDARNTPKPATLSADRIVLWLSAHGYEFNRDDAYYTALRASCGSNGHDYAFDPVQNSDPEKAYFCGMTYRVMRGLEYLKRRPEWDGKTLVVEGGSQGGLQSIWAAALVPGVTECRPFIPWCCNIGGPASGRARGDWHIPWVPALGYYDAANMARRIPKTCRVTVTWAGLGDYICPPSGVMAFYNNLVCPKQITWVQGATHGYYPPAAQTFTQTGDFAGASK